MNALVPAEMITRNYSRDKNTPFDRNAGVIPQNDWQEKISRGNKFYAKFYPAIFEAFTHGEIAKPPAAFKCDYTFSFYVPVQVGRRAYPIVSPKQKMAEKQIWLKRF